MDLHFCKHYRGNGYPPTNRFCRTCEIAPVACDKLWQKVVDLSQSNSGAEVPLPNTRAVMYPNPNNWNIVHLRINCQWNLPKEDFLHFIASGRARLGRKEQRQDPVVSPSMTRQEPYVQAIVEALGGSSLNELVIVHKMQKGQRTPNPE